MARIVPITLGETKTKTGKLYRVTLRQELVEDEAFPLDPKRQLYARIVRDGVLLTHKVNGDE
jgi:hypothetical protein